jgi:hypothetical protein
MAAAHTSGGGAPPKPLVRLLRGLTREAGRITGLLMLAAVVGLCALPLMERTIKFDEKSLMVGGARPSFR